MEFVSRECTVRTYRHGDAPSLARHGDNRLVWLNLRDRFPHPFHVRDGERYIAHVLQQTRPMSFAIAVDGEAVGGISLRPGDDVERWGAEIGYWLGEELWGRGIATAAVRLLTQHALTDGGFTRVFALPFAPNTASCRVLEKAGYTREGLLRKSVIKDGKVLDQYLYAAVRG